MRADESLNFTNRSKSFSLRQKSLTNNVIQRLQRRVSFRATSSRRESFNVRSNANLSIYRVSEASNESKKHGSASGDNGIPVSNRHRDKSQSGHISASFYFHASRLSAWQSDLSRTGEIDEKVEIQDPMVKKTNSVPPLK